MEDTCRISKGLSAVRCSTRVLEDGKRNSTLKSTEDLGSGPEVSELYDSRGKWSVVLFMDQVSTSVHIL